jgi:hypothetical protein
MSKKVTKEELLNRFTKLYGNKYNYEIDDFKNLHDKIILKCKEHGETQIRIWDHLNGSICKGCANKNRRDIQRIGNKEFIKRSIDKFGDKFDYSKVDYYNNRTKINLICKEHNIKFEQTPSQHLNGNISCYKCKKVLSFGESIIRDYLKENDIDFIEQHSYKDCRNKNILKFDFYLKYFNLIIEYDGKQHFVKGWNSEEEFERLKTNDIIKNKYCLDNNINLLRIPYTQFSNIINIIKQKLKLDK